MASLALSLASSSLQIEPAFVASRRVDFHLNKNSFSRWKHRQVDCFVEGFPGWAKASWSQRGPAASQCARPAPAEHVAGD